MNRFLFSIVLLLASVAHGQITYKAYTGSDVIQAGPPPFSASDPAGTCKTLPAPYGLRICKLTDAKTYNGASFTAGVEQASVSNTNSTLLALSTMGSVAMVYSFNPNSLQLLDGGAVRCAGQQVWSVNKLGRWVCQQQFGWDEGGSPANGTTISYVDFTNIGKGSCGKSNCFEPKTAVWTKAVDLATCPLGLAEKPTYAGDFTIGAGDKDLTLPMNWGGGQDQGHLIFSWEMANARHRCTTYDTLGNGVSPLWYNDPAKPNAVTNYFTGAPLQAVWKVHGSGSVGDWLLSVGPGGVCTGVDCGRGDDSIVIETATHSAYGMNNQAKPTGGHHTVTQTKFFNANGKGIYGRTLADPNTVSMVCAGDMTGEDMHLNADRRTSDNPVLFTRGGPATAAWTQPYMNEILGCDQATGKIYRFSPTWSPGPNAKYFNDHYGMTTFSQNRQLAFLTSSMQCASGPDCRTDVYVIDLGASTPSLLSRMWSRIAKAFK